MKNIKTTSSTLLSSGWMKSTLMSVFTMSALSITAHGVVYVWSGAIDSDWNNAANWDANGVPVDDHTSGGLTLNTNDSVVFSGTIMPSNNPGFGSNFDSTNSGKWSVPTMEFNSGGSIDFNLTSSHNNGMFTNLPSGSYGTRDILTVGDGITGGTEDVTVNLTEGMMLNRHANGIHNFIVNADGTLNMAGAIAPRAAPRGYLITVNGGTVDIDGNAGGLNDAHNTVDFTDFGGTFTADYGSFADIAAVTSALGTDFLNNTSGTLLATDNGDGSYTVSVVPEPSSTALLGLGGLALILRRRK